MRGYIKINRNRISNLSFLLIESMTVKITLSLLCFKGTHRSYFHGLTRRGCLKLSLTRVCWFNIKHLYLCL